MAELKNLGKLQRLLSLMDEDSLTKEQFKDSFKQVIDFIKKIESNNIQEFKDIRDVLTKFSDKLKEDNDNEVGNLKTEVNQLVISEFEKLMDKYGGQLSAIDRKMSEIHDGRDADESIIAENVLKTALETLKPLYVAKDTINEELPLWGAEIRDALEILQGDERLDISAIKGLKEALEVKGKVISSVGGGFNYNAISMHFADDESPTGSIDGVNTDFVLAHTPSPASSLKVWKDGQRMKLAIDFTLSGKTITFLSAPLSDSIITVDYRF